MLFARTAHVYTRGAVVHVPYIIPTNKRYPMADTASVPWRLFVKKFVGQFESKNIW
jgi:hypothetical protein